MYVVHNCTYVYKYVHNLFTIIPSIFGKHTRIFRDAACLLFRTTSLIQLVFICLQNPNYVQGAILKLFETYRSKHPNFRRPVELIAISLAELAKVIIFFADFFMFD